MFTILNITIGIALGAAAFGVFLWHEKADQRAVYAQRTDGRTVMRQ